MADTAIEWTDTTWNPVVGCQRVSEGCRHCYAERLAHRGMTAAHRGLTVLGADGPRWTGEVRFLPKRLSAPLSWRKPRRVFVDSMSDWLHEDITNEQVGAILAIAAMTPHSYQILTKRADRLPAWFAWFDKEFDGYGPGHGLSDCLERAVPNTFDEEFLVQVCNVVNGVSSLPWQGEPRMVSRWPLPNVWLGVSVEDQQRADERIPLLCETPAAIRFISAEPLLGPLDITEYLQEDAGRCGEQHATLDWVIAGCESGPGARPCDVAWLRSLRDQCAAGRVAFFLKQAVEVELSPGTCTSREPISAGPGSHCGRSGPISLPYLDGVQHAAFPGVTRG